MRYKLLILISGLVIGLNLFVNSEGNALSLSPYIQANITEDNILIIGFKKELSQDEISKFCKEYKVDLTRPVDKYHVYGFNVPEDIKVLNAIFKDNRVEYILPNFRLSPDNFSGSQTQTQTQTEDSILDRIRQANEQFLKQIGLWNPDGLDAIEYILNGELRGKGSVAVAIFESSGFAKSLIDGLGDRVLTIQDEEDITSINSKIVMGRREHGTGILSLIASILPENVTLMPVDFSWPIDPNAKRGKGTIQTLIDNIAPTLGEAEEQGLKLVLNISYSLSRSEIREDLEEILNTSYFGYNESEAEQFAEVFSKAEVERYRSNNIFQEFAQDGVLVASSGNYWLSPDIVFPAGYSDVIGVGAMEGDDVADYSSFGDWIDLYAPGSVPDDWIYVLGLSERLQDADLDAPLEQRRGGTSYAAPIISAISSLIYMEEPDLTTQEVRKIITSTSDKVYSEKLGAYFNKIDALEAVKTTRSYSGIKDMWKVISEIISEVTIISDPFFVEDLIDEDGVILGVPEDKIEDLRKDFDTALYRIFSNSPERVIEDAMVQFEPLFNRLINGEIMDLKQAKLKLNKILANMWSEAKEMDTSLQHAIALSIGFNNDKQALANVIHLEVPQLKDSEIDTIIKYSYNLSFSGSLSKLDPLLAVEVAHKYNEIKEIIPARLDELWNEGEVEPAIRLAISVFITQTQDRNLLTEVIKLANAEIDISIIPGIVDYVSQQEGGFDTLKAIKLAEGYINWSNVVSTFEELTTILPEEIKTSATEFWNDFMDNPLELEEQFNTFLDSLSVDLSGDDFLSDYVNKVKYVSVPFILQSLERGNLTDEDKFEIINDIFGTILLISVSSPLNINQKVDIIDNETESLRNLNNMLGPYPVAEQILSALAYAITAVEIGVMSKEQGSQYVAEAIEKYSIEGSEIISLWKFLGIPEFSEPSVIDEGITITPASEPQFQFFPFLHNFNLDFEYLNFF